MALHSGSAARIARKKAEEIYRVARQDGLHIELRNLSRTAIPADIRRAIARSQLQGVSDVAINYHHLKPTERAILTLTSPDHLSSNLKALENISIGGRRISARAIPPPEVSPLLTRTRGQKGRAEAMSRGIISGHGPHGGFTSFGKNVSIWGLPGRLEGDGLKMFLKGFNLIGSVGGREEVLRITSSDDKFTLVSRHTVLLTSMSEAHRLVRHVHLQYFQPDVHGTRFLMRARVIY